MTGVGVSYLVGLYRYDLFGYTPVDMSDVIDGITAPVIVLNPERRVVDFNAPASATFGALARGRRAREVLPTALVDAIPLDDIAESETEVSLTRDGDERIYRLYAAPLDSFGDSRGVAVTVRDVTTQRRQQENLDLLKQILTRALRHNIRNELDIVKANSRELVDRLDGDDRQRALAAIDAADDLLSISAKTRVMKNVAQNRGRTTTVDLSGLLDEIVAEYKQAYPDTSFLLECPPECPVDVTPDIRHALRNLIENAAEHDPTDTAEVRVTLEREDEGAVVEIADSGPGIPPNDLTVLQRGREHVLEHGSGIGLWIVTLVVEEIDGTIRYDTGDDGTTITLRIGS